MLDEQDGGGGVRVGSSKEPSDPGQIDTNPQPASTSKAPATTGGSSVADVMKLHKELKKHSEFQNKRN